VTVYLIAQLTIHDRDRYQRYSAALMPTLIPYGGSVLAADNSPEVLEGKWSGDRLVILSFPDRDACVAWATSAEYQQIIKDRLEAADTIGLLVHGLS
jgi:uncharacterized protein (DUF1330 family)